MDWLMWIWNLAPYWFQQILEILGIFLVLDVVFLFINNTFRAVEVSQDLLAQTYRTNHLLEEILNDDVVDEDKKNDDGVDEAAEEHGALEKRVAQAFSNDPILSKRLPELEIEALDGGVIELAGPVKNHTEWDHAVQVAGKVEGVNEVLCILSYKTAGDEDEDGDQPTKDSGILPGLEDVDPPDIRTESALFHSIPGPVGKIRD